MIPKITHQIWMQGFENIPDKFKKNVDALHALNPDYEHMQWDEASLRKECKKYGNSCLERYDSFEQMILKVDFGRYVVLYNYGGISVDTDMVQIKPINNLPHINSDKFIISRSAIPYKWIGMLNNAVIITPPGNEVLKVIIDTIINDNRKKSDFIIKELHTIYLTGPGCITNILYNTKMPHIIIDNKYFEPCSPEDILCKISNDTIMDHQHDASWVSSYLSIILKIFTFIGRLLPVFIIVLLCYFIYKQFIYKKKRRNA